MLRRFQTDTLRALLLALLLIAAQALLLQHQADLAKHATNDQCEWCLVHSPLTGTLPVVGLSIPATAVGVVPPDSHPVVVTRSFIPLYASRAPPFSLLS